MVRRRRDDREGSGRVIKMEGEEDVHRESKMADG